METARADRRSDERALPRDAERATDAPKPPPERTVSDDPHCQVLWEAYWRDLGDAARNRIVEAYQGLVEDVVRRFGARLPRSVDRGDLRTAANVGLMAAIESFDAGRGVRFEAYVEARVRGALLDELRTQDWLPRPRRRKIELQKRTVERLRAELKRDPRDDEVARAMRFTVAEYEQLFGVGLPGAAISVRGPAGADEGGCNLEVVADPRGGDPDERPTRDELLSLVAQRLTEQEYRIVYLRYWEELSMREIGELMGLSESRVYKIHARLLERLKDRFRSNAT